MAAVVQPFVCGGMAACFASCCIHPIDLAKVRIQLLGSMSPDTKKPSFPALLTHMVKTEGISSVYAGLSAAIMRQAIYGTARIGLHRTFSDKLQEHNKGAEIPFWMKTLSGMGSGAIAVSIGTPMDVALVRMQSDSMKPKNERRNYKHVIDALRRCAAEEGMGALYAGLAPNILRGMSMNVGMMACYDQAKGTMMKVFGQTDPNNPGLPVKLSSAAVAGFTAAAFSLPFDMLKSRLQDQKPDSKGNMPYKGLVDCASGILRKEGPLAFWTGFTAYYGRCAPHAMIILLSIESITAAYRGAFKLPRLPPTTINTTPPLPRAPPPGYARGGFGRDAGACFTRPLFFLRLAGGRGFLEIRRHYGVILQGVTTKSWWWCWLLLAVAFAGG